MKIFIFQDVDKVSGNYHPEGGMVVIAESEEKAKKLIAEEDEWIELEDSDWENAEVYSLLDELVPPKVIVFPDAGCC